MRVGILFFLVVTFLPAAGEDSTMRDSTLNPVLELQQLVSAYAAKGLPGLVVQIKQDSVVRNAVAGMADIERNVPMEPGQQFMVASVTKMFMAVLALKLAESGRLDLDKPITSFQCGNLFKKIENANRITVNHLLNHTSGLPDFIRHPAFFLNVLDKPYCDWRQKDLLRFLRKRKPAFAPGEKAAYSNSNFLLLTVLLDNEFGEKSRHFEKLQELIFQPLQMSQTVYTDKRRVPQKAAQGYADLYNNGQLQNLSGFNTGGSGNGYSGIYSTAADLQKFMQALFVDKTLLGTEGMRRMLQFVADSEDKEVAFGLGVWKDFIQAGEGCAGIGHRGRDIAYTADVWWFPSTDISVVVLMNCGAIIETETTRLYKSFRKELFELVLRTNKL